MTQQIPLRAIGLMSGSSLDGLDIACCDFTLATDGKWHFTLPHATTIPYDTAWAKRLLDAPHLGGKELWQLHAEFGHLCGKYVADFVAQHQLKNIDLVASHGHTIFHYPSNGFTTQIGDGAALAAECNLPVICDFRSGDVAKNGQGAPLVPMGDRLLFSDYRFLLNIGGIANITMQQDDQIIAFDICTANQILNYFAMQLGYNFDSGGKLAATGKLHTPLLDALNALDFYHMSPPKSLGNNFRDAVLLPLISCFPLNPHDILHTYCVHIGQQINKQIMPYAPQEADKLLVTGGGAFNNFLVTCLHQQARMRIIIPDKNLICFKEALIFAFLGVLRWQNKVNILPSVTGARRESIAGAIYLP